MAAVAAVVLLLLLNLIILAMVLGAGRDHDLTLRRIESELQAGESERAENQSYIETLAGRETEARSRRLLPSPP